MPAKIIFPSDEPDLTPEIGELDTSDLQDCMNIIQAYERGVHYTATEESVFAPVTHTVQSNKYWSKANTEILSSRLTGSNIIDGDKSGVSIRNMSGDITDALQSLKDDCVPCDDRIKLSLENMPSVEDLAFYLDDVRERIKLLGQIDKMLTDTDIFRDICPLLNVLGFMCIPDLQRMVAILMASLFRINFSMSDQFSLIVSLILPILMPILSGVVNMIDQYELLILSPVDCILDALLEQLSKLNGLPLPTRDDGKDPAAAAQLGIDTVGGAIGIGVLEMHKAILAGRNQLQTKLSFYTDAMKKAVSDWTGDSSLYLIAAAEKRRTIQLITLVVSLIELRKKGGKMCESSATPAKDELDAFFSTFLNKNSRLQFAVSPDGSIVVEEPGELLYQIEQPSEGAKIISYEPEDLLQKPSGSTFKCSLHTDPQDIDKINKWIRELNEAG